MATQETTETQILEALHQLDPHVWGEVLEFMTLVKHRVMSERTPAHTQPLTAADMVRSALVGLWADRSDIDDSAQFARQLRQQAEHRRGNADDRC